MNKMNIKKKIEKLNIDLLTQTKNKYDIRFYFQEEGNDSISSFHAKINNYITDDTRKGLLELKDILANNAKAFKIIKKELTRNILYIGSESDNLGRISIIEEYKQINNELKDKYVSIEKVAKPTIDNIISKWDSLRPAIIIISCHGDEMGLFLEDEYGKSYHYPNLKFIDFFERRSNYTDCIILSSCESLNLGKTISNAGKKVICINRKVDIRTATEFNKYFFRYINNHSLEYSNVYKDAFDYSIELMKFKELKDVFSFEFINANKIG